MARLGRPGEHPEGRFLPDTYHFPAGFTDEAFLRRALAAMDRRLAEAWASRAPDLPLSDPYQALILASIIEKETAVSAERTDIAGVFARRLRKGMRLQADPTVIYGLGGAFDGDLRRQDLAADTPYNTYARKGLPPTPIALPGSDSLDAAVHPASGDALYFVATGEGGHVFSSTLEQHDRAVRRYQSKGR
ncbi:MAG: endolytic transglycosylase MltG [Candidatus Competibacteraceae bacterium]